MKCCGSGAGRAAAKMDRRSTAERDLNEKLVFADNGEFFPGAPYLMPIVQPMESTLLDYVDPVVLILDEPEVLAGNASEVFRSSRTAI